MISELKEDLQNLLNSIIISIQNSKSSSELENIRINSLGKKGSITLYLKNIRDYDLEAKKEMVSDKNLTPFLLDKIYNLTKGESLKANIELVKNNADLACKIASCLIEEAKKI